MLLAFPSDAGTKYLALLLLALATTVVAQESRNTELPSDYMDQIRDQIYTDAAPWRADPEEEASDWRKPAAVPERKARFGYDPEFDERLHRNDYDTQRRFREPQPSTIFRVDID